MERSEGGKTCMLEKQRLDAEAFGVRYGRSVMFLPLSLNPSPQQVWIGWVITTTTEETVIWECLSQ